MNKEEKTIGAPSLQLEVFGATNFFTPVAASRSMSCWSRPARTRSKTDGVSLFQASSFRSQYKASIPEKFRCCNLVELYQPAGNTVLSAHHRMIPVRYISCESWKSLCKQ